MTTPGPWSPPTLHTRRLTLRALSLADLPAVHAAATSWPDEAPGSWLGASDPARVAGYLAEAVARYGRPPRCDLLLTPLDEDDRMVGAVAWRQVWHRPPGVEVGWMLHPDHVTATGEVLSAVVGWLFRTWPSLARAEVRLPASDRAGRAELEALGFRLEGVLRAGAGLGAAEDGLLFGLVRPDLPSPAPSRPA